MPFIVLIIVLEFIISLYGHFTHFTFDKYLLKYEEFRKTLQHFIVKYYIIEWDSIILKSG